MRALLMKSNASRKKSEKLEKRVMSNLGEGNTVPAKTVEGAGLIRPYMVKDMQVLQNVL